MCWFGDFALDHANSIPEVQGAFIRNNPNRMKLSEQRPPSDGSLRRKEIATAGLTLGHIGLALVVMGIPLVVPRNSTSNVRLFSSYPTASIAEEPSLTRCHSDH